MQADPRIIDAKVIPGGARTEVSKTLTVYTDTNSNRFAFFNPDGVVLSTLRAYKNDGTEAERDDDFTVSVSDGLGVVTIYDIGILFGETKIKIDYSVEDVNALTIIPVLEGGELPDQALLDKVLAAVSADNVRPMTDVVTVAAPTQVNFDVNLEYYVTAANEAAAQAAIEGEVGAIDQYIAWQRGAMDRDINPDKLRQLILNAGADRVTMVAPVYTQLDGDEVAAFSGTRIVTHVVEG
jgi:hypothetical protein